MKFFLLMIFYLINSPLANCHRYHSSDSDSDEVRMNSHHYSSESDSDEGGNRYPWFRPKPLPPWFTFPLWPLFPGLRPRPRPATVPPPPPPPPAPKPNPTTTPSPTPGTQPPQTTVVSTTESPRGDSG
ncbi:uncharacterized protein LOC130166647 [Seriola aureovittata]|uniref:uncharacterized protein LOC130166647 n=1 Tax=Seriola aureovittata TaxID=2871759 RepID=UPI0024BD9F69|nr:uncharacterized protein LOC130166647 [Seriola aureovittata]